jgi:hypothetical protein
MSQFADTNDEKEPIMINRIITGRAQFSDTELVALRALRTKYRTAQDMFTARELNHLRFLRWLVNSPGWNRVFDQADNSRDSLGAGWETPTWTLGLAR